MSDEKVRACALCEEQTVSVLCLDCCKYYCSECSQFIHKKPKKKDHRIRTFIDATHIISTANATTCPLHEGSKLTLFCMDDNELCCEDCISEGRHEGHKVVKVDDGEEDGKVSLNEAKEEFTKAMESADALEKKICKTIDDIQRENLATKERIKESFNEARMRLDAEEMCTHSQLDRVCTDAIGALKRIRDELALELENGAVLTNAADAGDIDRVRELSILSMMGRERRGMDSVHDSVITRLCVDWDGYERRLSFTKSLVSGVPVPSTIAFTAVNNDSVDVTWGITDAADNTPVRSDSMHFAVEVKKAAEEEEDWAEKYSGTDQKCTVAGLDAATEYEVRVRCVVGAQGGEWAGPAAVRTKKVDVRIDSVILSEEANQEVFDEKIIEWCGTNNFELLYRGSRDGFGGKSFHKHCNKRGRTLVLVKNNTGHVFGGFSSISWGSSGKWRKARGSFIFTLTNMHGTEPTKFALKNEDDESAVCHYGDGYGPVFGGGHDLLIYSDCNTNTGSYSNLPYVYNDTTGLGNSIFSSNPSSNHFNVHEIEVFRVI